jgi:GrpB-like predicted nucleotidyltransferase (UPF0157 family)
MTRKVEVVPHNPNWHSLFGTESKQIRLALGENAVAIHHIGSTSLASLPEVIGTIYAKPIIDILVEFTSISKVDERNPMMETIGYECMGEFGIKDRRFFRKDNAGGIRTHHIHIFEVNSAQIVRHLSFRDYLNTHTEDALKYSILKRSLAQQYPHDIERYMDGKSGFIQEIDLQAVEWRNQQSIEP